MRRVDDQDSTLYRTISMTVLLRASLGLPLRAFALAFGLGAAFGAYAMADDGDHHDHDQGRFKHNNLESGTLGWAEYGLYPGLYGFSLRWHLGYGYGLYALGVGADGGYPFYAGPGYPHEPPHLNRCGPDAPYAYFGGPDDTLFGEANFYQPVDGLTVTKPVVGIGEPGDFGYVGENGERNPGADFGPFTGAIPYPETKFAPYASAEAATGSSGAEGPPTTVPPTPAPTLPGRPSASAPPAGPAGEPVSLERPAFLPTVGNGSPPAIR
jgi:hypothetical protein